MDAAAAFGLSRDPFDRNCETDEQCLPNALAALLSELQAGLRSPQGLSVLIAEEASGKSLLARIFARRLAGRARAALISSPGPTVSCIVSDALAQLGVDLPADSGEEVLIAALLDLVGRRSAAGGATAIVIDDAHRLSPATLAGLARLFCEDAEEPPSLHLFLFGRPDLLDRMNATTDRALLEHLLQICRIEPLGVRDCIRYLERRLAAAAGELAKLFAADAIDDLIVASAGRLLRLEALTAAAMERAARAGCSQVGAEHVRRTEAAEGAAMAGEQQKLRLNRYADGHDDDDVTWGDEPEQDEEWSTDDDARDELRLSWGSSDNDDDDGDFEAGADDDEAEAASERPGRRREGRRGSVIAMGMFSVAACVLLTMAANSIESPDSDSSPGRTAEMFPKPVASEPTQIVRLPTAVAAAARKAEDRKDAPKDQPGADAAAHLAIWSSRDTTIDTHADDEIEIRELDAEAHEFDGEVMWEDELEASEREKPTFPKRDRQAKERAERERKDAERARAEQDAARAAAIPPDGTLHMPGKAAPAGIAEAMGSAEPDMPRQPKTPQIDEEEPHIVQAKAEMLSEPAPRSAPPSTAKPKHVTPPAAKAPAKASPPTASKPAATASASKTTAKPLAKTAEPTLYTIQLGAFRTRQNAEELAARLGARRVRIVNDAGLFRVMSGAFDNKKDAAAHEASLRRAGFNTFVREIF